MEKKNDYTIASVQRALRILKLFDNQHKEMTLTEISNRADMRKGTMLRILETLRAEHFGAAAEQAVSVGGSDLYALRQCFLI
ncbi:MAG: helix-turn-helix domain-containing protein [Faecalispora jeddahensis]